MKKITPILSLLLLACLSWAGPVLSVKACQSRENGLRLPSAPVCYVTSEKYPGDAFLDVKLCGVRRGFSLGNDSYPGWCTQVYNWDLTPGLDYCGAKLWLSTHRGLPEYLREPWGSINYVLNNKQGTPEDVQCAIWYLTDGYVLPEDQQTPAYVSLVEAACAHSDFVPGGNQRVAILLDLGSDAAPQRLFIEVTCPATNPGTRSLGYWKNHPEAWPVEQITAGALTYSKADAIIIMRTAGHGDKTFHLAAELIAAKLNILIGNDATCIAETVAATDCFLSAHPVGSGLSAHSHAFRREAHCLLQSLDNYNEGRFGRGQHGRRW